ncbi:tetratricopeptide repeat protein [Streptomyces phaeochromogenes]|uniref:tetratricopeptide repeat protein n=1 Tax=Streptomyces phaeochromogenes TaxID=1923 RepID=UPI0033C6D089
MKTNHCRQSLALAQETGDLNGQAHTWDSLGYIHHRLGGNAEAVDCYRQAIELFRRTGDLHSEAAGLVCLGDIHRATGRHDAAHSAWSRALASADELGLPETDPQRAGLLHRLRGPQVRATPRSAQRNRP